jgi:hypothetical protein
MKRLDPEPDHILVALPAGRCPGEITHWRDLLRSYRSHVQGPMSHGQADPVLLPSEPGSHRWYGWPHPDLLAASASVRWRRAGGNRGRSRRVARPSRPPAGPSPAARGRRRSGLRASGLAATRPSGPSGPSPECPALPAGSPTSGGLQTALGKNFSSLRLVCSPPDGHSHAPITVAASVPGWTTGRLPPGAAGGANGPWKELLFFKARLQPPVGWHPHTRITIPASDSRGTARRCPGAPRDSNAPGTGC